MACELLGLPYRWTQSRQEWELVPVAWTVEEEALAWAILQRIVHSKTHQAYLNLIDGAADLILVANPPSVDEEAHAAEVGVALNWEPIALDALVFLAGVDNPIAGLSSDQIRGIYTGAITRWSDVGGPDTEIHPYARPENSGSQQLMMALVMDGLVMPEWPPDRVPTFMGGLVDALKQDPNGVGYSVYYYVTYQYPITGLKLIAVDGQRPTPSTIRAASYPFTAPVLVVTRADLELGSWAHWLRDWLLSPEGQRVVQRSGYVPVGEVAAGAAAWAWPSCVPVAPQGACMPPYNGQPPAELGEPCEQCESGLVCTDRCRLRCATGAEPSSVGSCGARERCFSPTGYSGAGGYCAASCTPGAEDCPVGAWCQPRELDPDKGQWVGDCTDAP
jgi:phosphate transport system substrate-binding protein